jgi:hypothetical protein
MVEPRQTQLEDLVGDVVGPGSTNVVVELTGDGGGEISVNNNVIKDVANPVDGQDAVNLDTLTAAISVPTLAQVLVSGSSTGINPATSGNDIVISDGDSITSGIGVVTINDDLAVNGDAIINGKLTVTGLIDPTGIILAPQASSVGTNSLWMKTGTYSSLLFTNSNSTDVFEAGEDTETFLGIGASYGSSGAVRVPDDGFLASNDKLLIGYTTGDSNISIGDDGTGSGYSMTLYSSGLIFLRDPDGGSPKTRFSFDLSQGKLEFDNSNSAAKIIYEATVGAANTLTIQGQISLSGNGGAVDIKAGDCVAGSGVGGDLTVQSGQGFSDAGGALNLTGGQGTGGGNINITTGVGTTGAGGSLNLTSATGQTNGGPLNITAGVGTTGHGASVDVTAGNGNTYGGHVNINAGDGTTGVGGNISLNTGSGNTTNGIFNLSINNDSVLKITDIPEPESLALTTNVDLWMKATLQDGNKFYIGTISRSGGLDTADVGIFTGDAVSASGDITVQPGEASVGGSVQITGGHSATTAGAVTITGGQSDTTDGGNVELYGGWPDSSSEPGQVLLGTTDDGGNTYIIARVIDRQAAGPLDQIGRALRFDYEYGHNISIKAEDADGVGGSFPMGFYLWGSTPSIKSGVGHIGGAVEITAGDGGASSDSSGGAGGPIVLHAGGGGSGLSTGLVGYVEIDNILRMDDIGSTTLWTPGASSFLMFNDGGIPCARPASSSTTYKLALILQGTKSSFDFPLLVTNATATTTLTVTGAATGDHVLVTAPSLESGLIVRGHVSSANTVTITVTNDTSGSIDPAPQDYLVTVIKG